MRALILVGSLMIGVLAGGGASVYLGAKLPEPEAEADIGPDTKVHAEVRTDYDYVRLNSQFVIPIVESGRVTSLVALSLSLEVKKGEGDVIFAREPKLRDVFLRVMFDHANAGGFDGEFTAGGTLAALRRSLVESGRKVVGETISDVLITDIARQDS